MREEGAAPRSNGYGGAKATTGEVADIVSETWPRADCRAVEIALGGGFLALALLEAVFGW